MPGGPCPEVSRFFFICGLRIYKEAGDSMISKWSCAATTDVAAMLCKSGRLQVVVKKTCACVYEQIVRLLKYSYRKQLYNYNGKIIAFSEWNAETHGDQYILKLVLSITDALYTKKTCHSVTIYHLRRTYVHY